MSTTNPEEDPPQLIPDVEQQALQNHVHALLADRSMEELHAVVDRLAGSVTDDRRNLTHEIRHHLAEKRHLGRTIADHLPN
ncbi:hypothetical protein ACWDR1_29190 [Streptosporangium sandarakinum]